MGHGIGTDIIIAKAWINMYFSGLEVKYSEISNTEITSEIDRLRRAIKMLDRNELEDILKKDGMAELVCEFCKNKYHINYEEIQSMIESQS